MKKAPGQRVTEKQLQAESEAAFERGYSAGMFDAAQRIADAIDITPVKRIEAVLWDIGKGKLRRTEPELEF